MRRIIQVRNFLSATECAALIERLEQQGFKEQLSGDRDRVVRARCVFTDQELADTYWQRLQQHVPALTDVYTDGFTPYPHLSSPLAEFQPCGLNEVLRCYKYLPGEQFRRHEDFAFEWSETRRTFYTVLFYLNNEYTGGETTFDHNQVVPETGLAVIFPHELYHSGNMVQTGIKYAMRSDVIFAAPEVC
jgi:hypothetical protein